MTGALHLKLADGTWTAVVDDVRFKLKSVDGTWWRAAPETTGSRELKLKLADGTWGHVAWLGPDTEIEGPPTDRVTILDSYVTMTGINAGWIGGDVSTYKVRSLLTVVAHVNTAGTWRLIGQTTDRYPANEPPDNYIPFPHPLGDPLPAEGVRSVVTTGEDTITLSAVSQSSAGGVPHYSGNVVTPIGGLFAAQFDPPLEAADEAGAANHWYSVAVDGGWVEGVRQDWSGDAFVYLGGSENDGVTVYPGVGGEAMPRNTTTT